LDPFGVNPSSPAIDAVTASGVVHRLVHYGQVRGAEEAAQARGVDLSALAKTLVVRVEEGSYVLVCVPGPARLDYAALRSLLGVRRLTMPDPDEAREATGYARGTITPFGAGEWPVIVDGSLAGLDEVSMGAGIAEWAIHLSGADLVAVTGATVADVAG
jgi:Cys-tRNA(Pro)/Cys-tRNA(Cys) deacylase